MNPPSGSIPPSRPGLRGYFYSGWAFLVPYLAAYLLYYWRKWPANSSASEALGNGGHIPALLHVYWSLHAIHFVLAGFALRSWWRSRYRTVRTRDKIAVTNKHEPASTSRADVYCPPSAVHRPLSTAPWTALRAIAPWFFLALIFYIPGVYLEWPSDPWEHLRRITEWQTHATVGAHSAGYKSFYFFPYSLVGSISSTHLLFCLNVYYAGMCLLLAWQYYLLAKTAGFDRRWAFLSVIVNVLTFGNSCFSFYRYYGLASTIFAQIGAVALTRIAVTAARSPNVLLSTTSDLPPPRAPHTIHPAFMVNRFCVLCSGVALITLIACNHTQGLGIAGLAITSICVWKLLEWRRSTIIWLVAAVAALSAATVLWWPRDGSVESVYRPQGWLNNCYGLNLFAASPARDRALQILGLIGVVNLVAGILLLLRNQLVGWLTVGPMIALSLPIVPITFISIQNAGEMLTISRMIFAAPPSLALVYCLHRLSSARRRPPWVSASLPQYLAGICAIVSLTVFTPAQPFYDRTWNALAMVPQDLNLSHIISSHERDLVRLRQESPFHIVTTVAGTAVMEVFCHLQGASFRAIGEPVSARLDGTLARIPPSRDPILENESALSNLGRRSVAISPSTWTSLHGSPPEFMTEGNEARNSFVGLQNPAGEASYVVNSELVPIDRTKTYRLEARVRQHRGPDAAVYLLVAWHDATGVTLQSNVVPPHGAGLPRGWINGTYSYFGLAGGTAPKEWTKYSISFGLWEAADIPAQARYLRVGALLNYDARASAVIQLSNVYLRELPRPEITIITPPARGLYSSASQAALASQHWAPQQVANDHAGVGEIAATALSQGAKEIPMKDMSIYIIPKPASKGAK